MFEVSELLMTDRQQGLLNALRPLSGDEPGDEPGGEYRAASFRMKRAVGADVVTFVAREGRDIIGTASVIIEPKLLHGGSWAAHLEDVSVAAGHQKRGVGKALVEAAVAYARGRGCYKIILDCGDAAVPFYERLGFARSANAMRMDLDCVSP